jgi:hypothetical protein
MPGIACEGRAAKPSVLGSPDFSGHLYREPERTTRAVDHGTNVTFVIYPKADSSRIVKRQGIEPLADLKTGFDRFMEHQ